jgi:ferric-dicitrate binding protein FerR (iron transport regulator)
LALGILVLAGTLPGFAAEPAVGRVVQQQGDVRAARGGAIVTLAVGAEVLCRDRIVSGPDGRVHIEFVDRSLVAIGSDTEVLVADYAAGRDGRRLSAVLSLLSGIVRAVVAEPGGSFDITSRAAVASARSTEWLMEATGAGTAVFAAAGVVAVQSVGTNAVVELTPGMGTDVTPGGAPNPPKPWGKARVEDFIARTRLPGE